MKLFFGCIVVILLSWEAAHGQTWQAVQYANGSAPLQRHENGFVEVGGKFYLVGGRGIQSVNIFDPVTRIWTAGAPVPVELHHFQAVAYQNNIYVIGAMTGGYPDEVPVDRIYIYNPQTNAWTQGPSIPAARRRGSAGVVVYDNKFYIVGGIQNGHRSGWVPWLDVFDPAAGTWSQLANAPEARDHFHAALINGKIYCAGGRRTSQPNPASNTVSNVDVYDIQAGTWSTPSQIPTPRGGAAVFVVNNELIVAGGEVDYTGNALTAVESYSVTSNLWTTKTALNAGRHGTQSIFFNNSVYLCAGSSTSGGGGENNTMAVAVYGTVANTPPVVSQAYPDQNIPSTQTSIVVNLGQVFSDNGGVNNLTFTVPNNTNAALISNTQIVGSQLTFTLSGTTGTGMITLRATDASNAFVEDVFQLTVTSSGTPQLVNVIRINSGGGTQNFGGEAWVADQYFTGGTPYSTTSAISNTTQDQIYQSERFGNFTYAIPVPSSGTYAVDLHLAEIYFNTTGSRVFSINIENGQFVRTNVDLIQTIGSVNQAFVLRADNLNITDGIINISVTSVVNNGKISGIAVGRYNTAPVNTPPVVAQAYSDQNIPSTQTNLVVNLGQIFNDNGGVNNLAFTVPNNTNAALISNTQIVGSQVTFTLSGATGTGMITLRATDASNAFVEDMFQLTVTSSGTPQLVNVIRINSGGGAQNFGGEAWVADQYFTGGTPYSTTSAISNTTQDQIYQSERFGNFTYAIPVPSSGTYAVDLHLAEIYFNTTGSRVFNINIENGQFVRTNLDLIQTIGSINQAFVLRADNLNITDGIINISVTSVVDNGKISGVVVGRYNTAPVNTPPVVAQAYPDQNIPSTQTNLVVNLGQIFNDNGGVNNLAFTVPNNTNAALISNTQIVGSQLTFTLSGTTGTGMITLRATDASNAFVEDVFQLTVTSSGTPQLVNVIRINSGGGAQNFGGEAWVADQYFTGGTPYSTTSAISNTTQDQIYQSERFGNFTYAIPVPSAGTYAVDLHLAEIYFNTTGSRTFNINIENGQFVRTNLDLIQLAGSINRAYVLRADNLSVLDGTLNITFTTGINNAKISGISVGQYIRETAIARKIFSDEIPQLPSPSERYSTESFIFPNPAVANITLSLNVKSEGEYDLTMWNLSGADLQLGVFTLSRGHQLLDLDLSTLGLNAGLYILAIEGPGEKQYLRVAIR